MLDRILNFLFRKNTGLSILAILITSMAFVLGGCSCDCGLCAYECDGNGGFGCYPGCICSRVQDCNQKCDQSCGACHTCNTCLDDCSDACFGGCSRNCSYGCEDCSDNCYNGCKDAEYNYRFGISTSVRDDSGKEIAEGYVTIWSDRLTRKEAESKPLSFTVNITDSVIQAMLGNKSYMASYYKVKNVVAVGWGDYSNDPELSNEVDYSIEYQSGKLTVSTPNWKDKYTETYSRRAIVVVEEVSYGEQVEIVVRYPDFTGKAEEKYTTKVGQSMPTIPMPEIYGYTANKNSGVWKDDRQYVINPDNRFHIYDWEGSRDYSYNDGIHTIVITPSYNLNHYKLSAISILDDEAGGTKEYTVEHGKSLGAYLKKIKQSYSDLIGGVDLYSAEWTLDKYGESIIDDDDDRAITSDLTVYFYARSAIEVTLHNLKAGESETKTLRFPKSAYIGWGDYVIDNLSDYGNFKFKGWYTDSQFNTKFEVGEYNNSFDLYAQWVEDRQRMINYYASLEDYTNGNTWYFEPYEYDKKKHLYTHDVLTDDKIRPSNYEQYKYTFEGWRVVSKVDGEITLSDPMKEFESNTYDTNLDLVVAFSHKVKLYVKSDESLNGALEDYVIYYRQSFDLPLPTHTDKDKRFVGWQTDNGTLISDRNGHIESFVPSSNKEPVVETSNLIPKWEDCLIVTEFTWNENGESRTETRSCKSGESITAPTEPDILGYDFVGWYNGDVRFNEAEPVTEKVTYTAKFQPKTFTITLIVKDKNGNERERRQVEVKYGEKVNLGVPEIGDSTFYCWKDEGGNVWTDGEGKMTKNYDLLCDITLYADIWW